MTGTNASTATPTGRMHKLGAIFTLPRLITAMNGHG